MVVAWRHLLFQAALRRHFHPGSDVYLWQYHGAQGFTISIPSEEYIKEADYFGIVSAAPRTSLPPPGSPR